MKSDKFIFHISAPNNEDVEPIDYRDWLAVADGMGGSGCMKHEVQEEYRYCLSRILEYVLPEYTNDRKGQYESEFRAFVGEDPETSYLARIFAPCIHDAVNTSARWASRIVMTRFLYYISEKKFNPNNTEEVADLCDFLQMGLKRIAATLSLTVSNLNMSLLPTTFAALRYHPISEEEYEVHAVWAGDSRCYLLNKDGLARLSADDENEYKQLTNNFGAEEHTVLHCRRYLLKKPFLLFCASDGFFDAYDKYELSVEAHFLKDIFEANNFAELRERLVERYKCNLADDTSVALAGVGFSEYSELCTMLSDRWRKVGKLYKQHREYAYIASLISRPELHVTGTVCDRFETKFSEIIRRIAAEEFKGQDDPLITPHWRQLISESKVRKEEELRRQLNERKEKLSSTVWEEIGKSNHESCFVSTIDFGAVPWGKILKSFCEADDDQTIARVNIDRVVKLKERFEENFWSLLFHIYKEMNEACTVLQSRLQGKPERSSTVEQLKHFSDDHLNYCKQLNFLAHCECLILKGDEFSFSDKSIGAKNAELVKKIRDYRSGRLAILKDQKTAEEICEKRQKGRSAELSKLKPYIPAMLENRENVFTTEFIVKLQMNEIMNIVVDSEELLSAVTDDLIIRYADDREILRETLDDWKKITDRKTCIDDLFPAGKLSDFRQYYKNRNLSDSEEFCRYKENLEQIEGEYDRMLRPGYGTQNTEYKVSAEEPTPTEIPKPCMMKEAATGVAEEKVFETEINENINISEEVTNGTKVSEKEVNKEKKATEEDSAS